RLIPSRITSAGLILIPMCWATRRPRMIQPVYPWLMLSVVLSEIRDRYVLILRRQLVLHMVGLRLRELTLFYLSSRRPPVVDIMEGTLPPPRQRVVKSRVG